MSLSVEDLQDVRSHWALRAVGQDALAALHAADSRLVLSRLASVVEAGEFKENDPTLVDRVATAYELAAAEGLQRLISRGVGADDAESRACRAAAHQAFELRRTQDLPEDPWARAYFVLRVGAIGNVGERGTDVRRWLKGLGDEPTLHAEPDAWDQRVMQALFQAWIGLLRRDGWSDLSLVSRNVDRLRGEQESYEPRFLGVEEQAPQPPEDAGGPDPIFTAHAGDDARAAAVRRTNALRLLALYHLARATELVGQYLVMGPGVIDGSVDTLLDQHLDTAQRSAQYAGDVELTVLITWLHAAGRMIVSNSVWRLAEADAQLKDYVAALVDDGRGMIEFLPPQRAALLEHGLLDPARRAVVVDLPTSGGKTALAEFRILQAVHAFQDSGAWIAYIAPTRALVAQTARTLRARLSRAGIRVEALTGALEVDAFEEELLRPSDRAQLVDVFVLTPEKLDVLVRNRRLGDRRLSLVVLDEAHNIEDSKRGLGIELALATVKSDEPAANFLLLMPYVPNADDLARWLSPDSGRSISFSSTAWRPNDVIVGLIHVEGRAGRGNWGVRFEPVQNRRALDVHKALRLRKDRPLPVPFSQARRSLTLAAGAMATCVSSTGASIVMTRTPRDAWAQLGTLLRSFRR